MRRRRSAAAAASSVELVRSSRQSDRPEIAALFGSKTGSFHESRAGELGRQSRPEKDARASHGRDVEVEDENPVERRAVRVAI